MAGGGAPRATRLAPARMAALDLLSECRRRDARARDLLRNSPELAELGPRDRALATRLVLGAVRTSGLCDAVVESHLTGRGHLEPRVRDALRLACFELLYLSTPPEVAVSQGVEMARRANRRAAGLANAVLRRVAKWDVASMGAARSRIAAAGVDGTTPDEGDVALVAAVPEWLAHELLASADPEAAPVLSRRVLSAADAPTPTAAANLCVSSAGAASSIMDEAGLDPWPLPWPGAFLLGRQSALATSGLVEGARVLPADLAAQVVAWLAAPAGGGRALEVGQGRATKTILMAGANASLGGSARFTAIDLDGSKVRVARDRVACSGLSDRVTCLAFDATRLDAGDLPPELEGTFDSVFVDAPCSGTGTLRRHPEIAWSLDRPDVSPGGPMASLQLRILSAAAGRVAPGGTLLYATCSELAAEDEEVVSAFLASDVGAGFSVESPAGAPAAGGLDAGARSLLDGMETPEGFIRTSRAVVPVPSAPDGLAGPLLCDGHFLARLRRRP